MAGLNLSNDLPITKSAGESSFVWVTCYTDWIKSARRRRKSWGAILKIESSLQRTSTTKDTTECALSLSACSASSAVYVVRRVWRRREGVEPSEGLTAPRTGFEDQRHHRAPSFSSRVALVHVRAWVFSFVSPVSFVVSLVCTVIRPASASRLRVENRRLVCQPPDL